MNLVNNKFFIFFLVLYAASLVVLTMAGIEAGDVVVVFAVVGVGFSALTRLATARAEPLPSAVEPQRAELPLLIVLVIFVTSYLIWGGAFVNGLLPADWIESPQINYAVGLAKKLSIFVALPFASFRFLFGYRWRDFGLSGEALRAVFRNHLPAVLSISLFVAAFQFFASDAAVPVRRGELTATQLLIGAPLCFLWLALEAGLVEEFFFRALLQTRLSVFFKSKIAGVVLSALVFGLAHAPGIYLRGGAAEQLGENPSLVESAAYSIAVLAVGGVFLGVVWARTKNLFAVVIIHAAADLLPNLTEFFKIFHLK